jgi:hypothetical protein
MPTLYGARAREKFVKEVPKDILLKLFIMRLKTKGETKGRIFNLQL